MQRTLFGEWVMRGITIGLAALSGWIGGQFGEWVGAGAAIAATAAATKTLPYILPTKAKVAAGNMIPPVVKQARGSGPDVPKSQR